MTADLLDALDALTKPTHRKIIQDDPNGPELTKVVHVEDDALLDQLDNAIRSSMGGTTSGGSDPATRSLVDSGALMRFMQISSEVQQWARVAGAVIDKASVGITLRNWFVRFKEYPISTRTVTFYTKQLRKWAFQIEATLNPPKEKDLPDACPSCGASEWWDPATKERYYRPLVIRYQPDSPTMVDDARGVCRACAKTWGVRELQFEIEEKQAG
ncbi:hypothetical protein E3T43_01210 [Cryobacterium sp. Hh7]|uniref:DUF7341 domain-containing protein n=1 Tax=Cryobacterium sp. Hh7 TaxID=1259159 RepID=UPI001068FF38|nr:hypothetical protein [Cryobacterium sp. Hh7]TFD61119.1 hypothetical protein E3T43_01210 [Cryobacterium sp. Hh7]